MLAARSITVYVADDHPIFLDAVGRAVNAQPDIELVGLGTDGREALSAVRELKPSVAIIDHQLPSLSGVEILRAVQHDLTSTRVIILSAEDSSSLVYEAMQLGAAGFLTKLATLAEICDAILVVARGGTVIAPEVQSGLVGEMRAHSEPGRPVLTQRESEVLRLIAGGLSAPEIGARLFISPSTVRTHVKGVFEKLGVNDRAAAVAEGMRRGLLE